MIELRLSGGASNASVSQSIGGAISSVQAPARLMPSVTPELRGSGVTWYSCVYVRASSPETAIRAWVGSDTPSPNSAIAIGWGATKNTTQASVANQLTPPSGVTFSSPTSYSGAPTGDSYAANDYRALWIRYTLNPGSTLIPLDVFSIRIEGTPSAPSSVSPPVLSGTVQRGQTLAATVGTWTGSPYSYAYQWQRSADGTTWTSISGATASSYFLQDIDVGQYIRCLVTATNVGGSSSASSAPTTVVVPTLPVSLTPPVITGTATVGHVLTLVNGTWAYAATFTYQWQRSNDGSTGWANIGGATSTTHTLAGGDEGKFVRCVVTATNVSGSASASTAASAQVTSASVPPSVRAFSSGTSGETNTTTHTVTMPTGIVAGDRILVLFCFDGDHGFTWNHAALGPWSEVFKQENNWTVNFLGYTRIAAGTESGQSMNITTGNAQLSAWQVYVIRDCAAISASGENSAGSTTSMDPPAHSPAWGAAGTTLWIAAVGHDNGSVSPTAYPANYTDGAHTLRSPAGDGCGVASARRSLSATTENPGAFTFSNTAWYAAVTIACQQA